MKFTSFIILLLVFQSFELLAQHQIIDQEEKFEKLRKELMKAVVVHPIDSLKNKYVCYSFELRFNEELEVIFSKETPWKVLYSKNRTNIYGENFLKKRIQDFIIRENIVFEDGQIILYPVLQIWQDKEERDDNLEEAMMQLFDDGKNYSGKNVRIEKPIVTGLLGKMEKSIEEK